MPYICIFIFSIILLKIIGKHNIHKEPIYFILFFVSAFIPCILAGMRADTVGTDVVWYVTPLLKVAKANSNLFSFVQGQQIEPLYSTIVYMLSRVSNDCGIILFTIQALTIIPVYCVLYRNRITFPMWIGGTVYYFLLYNYSYSLMRQCLAGAFLLLMIQLCLEGKKIKGLIMGIIAILFHYAAIVFVIFVMIYFNLKIIRNNKHIQRFIIVLTAIVAINIKHIITVFTVLGVLDEKYLNRVNYYTVANGNYVKITYAVLFACLSMFALIRAGKKKINISTIIHILAVIALFFAILGELVSGYLSRLSYYFYFFYIVSIPDTMRLFKGKTNVDQGIIYVIFGIIVWWFWYYAFIMHNSFETFPYIIR